MEWDRKFFKESNEQVYTLETSDDKVHLTFLANLVVMKKMYFCFLAKSNLVAGIMVIFVERLILGANVFLIFLSISEYFTIEGIVYLTFLFY